MLSAASLTVQLTLLLLSLSLTDPVHTAEPEANRTLRIFNGDGVGSGDIPFIVRLNIYSNFLPGSYYVCGGSIISENWVITAAHCVVDSAQYKMSNQTTVMHGANVMVTAGDVTTRTLEESEVSKRATQVFVHENYNEWYLQNDVALLYFKDGFNFGSKISAVSLGTTRPSTGATVTVAGWGTMEDFTLATELLSTTYTVPDQSSCAAHYDNNGYTLLPGMWCTGDSVMTTHSATGDSGGPVFKSENGGFTLYGLVSWGVDITDVQANDYDINSDVVYFKGWITGIMSGLDNYRLSLSAGSTAQTVTWSTGTDKLRYQVYLLSCTSGRYIQLTLTKVLLSGDYSHVTVRDGGEYNSPVLHQQHQDREDSKIITSSSTFMLVLIRTTDSTNDKTVQFEYRAVSDAAGSGKASCGDYMSVCDNRWECYDPLYRCDGSFTDCKDRSDETTCGAERLGGFGALFIIVLFSGI